MRDFCIIILVSGALRELLRHNTLLGLPVAMSIRTEAAEQPFFGLILSGFLLAVLRAVEATLRPGYPPPETGGDRGEGG